MGTVADRFRRFCICLALLCALSPQGAIAQSDPAVKAVVAQDIGPLDIAEFERAVDLIERNYVHPVPRRQLIAAALQGMLRELDPYSGYLGPDEWRFRQQLIAGAFGGIGVFIEIDPAARRPRIAGVYPGSPAHEAGIVAGDLILRIDARDTEAMTLEQALAALPGKPGSAVELSLQRGSAQQLTFAMIRRIVERPSVRAGIRGGDGYWADYLYDKRWRIGYIRIHRMAKDTSAGLERALTELKTQGMRGLVLDLRANPGGLQSAAVGCADLFIDSGRLLTETVHGDKTLTYDAKPGGFTDFPMAVLIDGQTASSAEILSAALQDNRRATIVGQRSYGKGLVQTLHALDSGQGGLTITSGAYRRPSGRNIDRHTAPAGTQEWGVAPDPGMEVAFDGPEYERWLAAAQKRDEAFVPSPADLAASAQGKEEDRPLARALEILQVRLAEP